MTTNVGTFDRIARLVLGLILIAAPFLTAYGVWQNDIIKYGAVVVGAVLALTAIFSICPLYSLLGVRTCRTS